MPPSPAPLEHPERGGRIAAQRQRKFADIPHRVGLVVGIFAVACFLWSVSHVVRLITRIPRDYVDHYYFNAPNTSLSWALLLALLAGALAARKRVAWWVLTLYLLAFTAGNVAEFLADNNIQAAVAAGVHVVALAFLVVTRSAFDTRVRPGAAWKALGVLAAGLALSTLIGWGVVQLFPGTLPFGQRLFWAANRVTGAVSVANEQFDGVPPVHVDTVLGLLGAVALLTAVVVLFRSQRSTNALTGPDESALRGLLERSAALEGQEAADSLGYFATRRDKAVVFAPSGKAAVTFRVELGVCVASGDPIGLREAWPHAIESWLEQCDQFGWAPGVMGASMLGAQAYRRAGLSVLQLGDEAILDPRTFTLNGAEMKPVRQAANRLKKHGCTVRIRRHREISADEMNLVMGRADAWRDTEHERGFSMALGRLGDPLDGNCLLVETVDAEQRVLGMLSLVPWGRTGVSLDLMRRDPTGPNGVMELMVSELLLTADRHGITKLSLNFAVLRSAFEDGGRIGAGPLLRLWRTVLVFFSRWWQLEAMYRSNVKYRPGWVPRFICFEDARQIPRVGIAAALVEGFLPRFGAGRATLREHTGIHRAVPDLTGLHADGSAPAAPTGSEREGSGPRRPEQVRVRLDKLERLRADGVDGYPVAYPPTHTVAGARIAPAGTRVRISGRLLRIRDYGGVCFAVVRDWSGDVQLLLERERLGVTRMRSFARTFDLGDLIQVSGTIGHSRRGELSLLVADWRMNGKCLHPLPDKWRGLADPEARVRQRYVDMAINPEVRDVLTARSAVLRALRDTLGGEGFLEVETPILQRVHGGANAAPFTTHINAYDLDLYLRIAPELYLKRLCVGGVERVFELGRTFRNEGVDYSHNPEFTILEAYQAHSDYIRMMHLTYDLIQNAATAAHGKAWVMRPGPDGALGPVDISGEWPVKTVHGAVSEALGAEVTPRTGEDELRRLCDKAQVGYQTDWDAGQLVLELYEHLVEAHTQMPTFYKDFPTSVSPLTRAHRTVTGVAERWDLVAWGVELGTAYSELTDPVEQRKRLTRQSLLAAGGDPEAMELDEDFLQALEHGMPPTGGLGLGVDRLVMLVTGRSIRETLPFPLVRPKGH
ncbi:MAG: bifunctional lysylphosphatidylglycerol synthetase/lysine--tRNA ligase LysX [Mycobacteriaceae bacterium]|nr:bifunctional lysylphosphatidylglycerol synthetase/lysine--tRNA ligase LysX [Mycobacteriaceae bacterium]